MQAIGRSTHTPTHTPTYTRSHRAFRAHPIAGLRDGQRVPALAEPALSVRVLDMAAEQALITGLRQHAPLDAERDLDPGVFALEDVKDRLGVVMAIRRHGEVIATIRFIPFGHGVTLAEKRRAAVASSTLPFGAHSWEVGRLIVAPEHRSMALLRACIFLAMQELVKSRPVHHLHAACSPLLARLYRCFGFVTDEVFQSDSGTQHVLIRATLTDVVRALGGGAAQQPLLPGCVPA